MIFVSGSTDRLISAIRQAVHQSQSEVIIFLLFLVTYFAGFAKARRWSVCAGTVPKVTGPRAPGPKTPPKVTVGPTKTTAAKTNLPTMPTTRRLGQWDADTHLIKTTDR